MMTSSLPARRPALSLVRSTGYPVVSQLRLEEALLRTDSGNWCLINRGTPPAIVLGISGKPELLVDPERMAQDPVPLIRRFSGGGTVYVDHHTTFVTWIWNASDAGATCCPSNVHNWVVEIYRQAFPSLAFHLRENDYVIGDRKWGGNAQYLCRGRWLHHTSILWDYDPQEMERLLLPAKRPAYRSDRPHGAFLCRLRDHFPDRGELEEQLVSTMKRNFEVLETPLDAIRPILDRPHRKATEEVVVAPK